MIGRAIIPANKTSINIMLKICVANLRPGLLALELRFRESLTKIAKPVKKAMRRMKTATIKIKPPKTRANTSASPNFSTKRGNLYGCVHHRI